MSDLVGNPEDRFSHNEAHIILNKTLLQGYRDFEMTYRALLDEIKTKQIAVDENGSKQTWKVV